MSGACWYVQTNIESIVWLKIHDMWLLSEQKPAWNSFYCPMLSNYACSLSPLVNVNWGAFPEVRPCKIMTVEMMPIEGSKLVVEIWYVTRPAKINYVSANYTELYFRQYLQFWMWYPISINFRRKPIKFYSSDRDFIVFVQTVRKLW